MANDLAGGGAAHDGILHQQDVLPLEDIDDGVQLLLYGLGALRLPRHDERAADVAVLDEALAELDVQGVRQRNGGGAAGFRYRYHHVNVVAASRMAGVQLAAAFRVELEDARRQLFAHAQPRLVDRNAIHHGVFAGEIDMLENARPMRLLLGAAAGDVGAAVLDVDGLARRHVALELEAQNVDGVALRRHHDFLASIGVAQSEAQRPDAVRIAEGDDAAAVDHRHRRIAAATASMHAFDGAEDMLRARFRRTDLLQFVGEDVEQDLGIRGRIDVPQPGSEHAGFQFGGVGEVAVVGQTDAVGRVDVHGLRFRRAGRARRRIANVADAHGAAQPQHVAFLEHVSYQTVAFAQLQPAFQRAASSRRIEAFPADHAGRVLAAVLQRQQGVVDLLVDWRMADDADDAAHSDRLAQQIGHQIQRHFRDFRHFRRLRFRFASAGE